MSVEPRTNPLPIERPPRIEAFEKLWKLDDDDKDAIVDQNVARFGEASDAMEARYPTMIEQYRAYRSIARPLRNNLNKKIRRRANLYIPYPHAIVESAMPRLAGRLPRVRATPRKVGNPERARQQAEVVQENLYYTFDRMQFVSKAIMWLRQHEIYGWSPLRCFWRHEEREILKRVFSEPDNAYAILRETETIFDDFWTDVLDVFDCFPQPGTELPEEGDWWIHREWLSQRDIVARANSGIFYEDAKSYAMGDAGRERRGSESGRNERDELARMQSTLGTHGYGKHELLWVYEGDRIYGILDRTTVATASDNPDPRQEIPIITCALLRMKGEQGGIGSIEQLAGLPQKLNALSNARLDNIALTVNKVFLVDRYSNTDFDNVVWSPGNHIMTDDVERSVKVLEPGNVGAESEREILTTKEELQFASGISDFIVGQRSSARLNSTATGVSSLIREANARFALRLAAFEGDPLRRLVYKAHAWNMLYQPYEKQIFVHGPKGWIFKTVRIEDVLCECDLVIEPGSTIPLDQVQRRDSLSQLLPQAIGSQTVVRLRRLWQEVLDANDIRNPGEFLVDEPTDDSDIYADFDLAKAENIALSAAQAIPLRGDDALHVQVHSQPLQTGEIDQWDPESRDALEAHLAAHQQRLTARRAMALTAGRGGLFGGTDGSAGEGLFAGLDGGQAGLGGGPGAGGLAEPGGGLFGAPGAGGAAAAPGAIPALAGTAGVDQATASLIG